MYCEPGLDLRLRACLDRGVDGGRILKESQKYLLFSPVGILEEFEETVLAIRE